MIFPYFEWLAMGSKYFVGHKSTHFYTSPIFKSLIVQPDTNSSSVSYENYNDTLQRFIFSWSVNAHMVWGLRSTISGYI